MADAEEGLTDGIVVGIDGSDSSIAALNWAGDQAELTGSSLRVVMAWEWPPEFGWALALPAEYTPEKDARKVLDDAVARVRTAHPEVRVRSTVIERHPAPALVEASREADLLVLGSRGHGEFVGMLLGSVSEHCVTHAHCPVVVVRGRE